ncbi:hypothetical protein ANN_12125 [Periplaneta americana]|uniref:Uncharacterized protein n=1 Tax=Periplaneta americana TaxID=6978 RepID=A0ABQ8T6Z0_PERAM|nr:hypothetical protein ANN_12125 [Periplaneta americana]
MAGLCEGGSEPPGSLKVKVRRSGDIEIILYTPVENSRYYDFAIKEEAPANSMQSFQLFSQSKPELSSQTCDQFDSVCVRNCVSSRRPEFECSGPQLRDLSSSAVDRSWKPMRCLRIRFLGKYLGLSDDEVTGEWRNLHNTELHALYSSPDIIRNIKSRRLRWAGHVARMGESRNAYRVLVGRPEGKRPLGRPRRRWEDNIKMDLREVGCDDRDWINLAQDRDRWRAYVRAAMNLRSHGWGKPPIICLRYAEKSLATSDTTPLKMSAAVADETSVIKPTNRPRPLSPENESTSIDSGLLLCTPGHVFFPTPRFKFPAFCSCLFFLRSGHSFFPFQLVDSNIFQGLRNYEIALIRSTCEEEETVFQRFDLWFQTYGTVALGSVVGIALAFYARAKFADDIAVLSKGDTGEQVTTNLQNFLQEIEIWDKKWRTAMNTNKSSTVTLTYLKKEKALPLYLNCSPVPQHEVRYLGLILDSRLTWNKHLAYTLQRFKIDGSMDEQMNGWLVGEMDGWMEQVMNGFGEWIRRMMGGKMQRCVVGWIDDPMVEMII